MTSPLVSQLRDQYSLAWTVQSFLRIEEARILYRRLMVSVTVNANFHPLIDKHSRILSNIQLKKYALLTEFNYKLNLK